LAVLCFIGSFKENAIVLKTINGSFTEPEHEIWLMLAEKP